jgi:chromosome segregation ATPase
MSKLNNLDKGSKKEISELNNVITKLKNERDKVKQDIYKLNNIDKQSKYEISQLNKVNHKLKNEKNNDKQEISKLNDLNKELKKEISELNKVINKLKTFIDECFINGKYNKKDDYMKNPSKKNCKFCEFNQTEYCDAGVI